MDVTKLDGAVVSLLIAWAASMVIVSMGVYLWTWASERMGKQQPMTGAKLSWRVVNRMRELGDQCDVSAEARKYQVHPKTIERILQHKTWVLPQATELDTEHKECVWCGKRFARRFASGRWRGNRQWAQKRTCGPSCNMYLMWQSGVYDRRGH